MTTTSQQDFATRALNHARAVVDLYPRGSATPGEKRAADYVTRHLAALGIKDMRSQPFQGLRSIWLFISLAFGSALVGHAAYWLLKGSIGALSTALIVVLFFAWGALLIWRKFTFRSVPLIQSLPHGPSQNVLAILPPVGEVRQKVVLLAHLDSHRAVWLFATDLLVRFYALIAPLAILGIALAPLLYLLAELTRFPAFAYLAALLAALHFIAWFTGMTADLGLYSPGANDNASAVGTLLALAERLQGHPLQHTEIWLAFTGCEETGCGGMQAFLGEYGSRLKQALFVDFELVGIGDRLVYLRSEGVVRRRRISAQVEQLIQAVAGNLPLSGADVALSGAFTEAGVAWEHGFAGVCIMAQRAGDSLAPEWHRLTDRGERLEKGALGLAHEFAWQLLHTIDTNA